MAHGIFRSTPAEIKRRATYLEQLDDALARDWSCVELGVAQSLAQVVQEPSVADIEAPTCTGDGCCGGIEGSAIGHAFGQVRVDGRRREIAWQGVSARGKCGSWGSGIVTVRRRMRVGCCML